MRVERLVKWLSEEADLTATEIAELLWLALRIQPEVEIEPDEEPKSPPAPQRRQEIREETDNIELSESVLPSEPVAEIAAPIPQTTGKLPTNALPIWIADPPLLGDSLSLICALRPLLKRVEVGTSNRLDEAATVDRIAKTQIWIPILKPETEPGFEVVLVVDRGVSMNLWRRLTDDIVLMLRRYGAFRDLRIFDLKLEAGQIVLRSPTRTSFNHSPEEDFPNNTRSKQPNHDPREIIEPNGRRIVLILSDCVASYWWDGKLNEIIRIWSKSMPIAIWQMLPEWMWQRTALGRGTYVAVRNSIPGAINTQLKAEVLGLDEPEDRENRLAVPVITSEKENLVRWSRVLTGDRREVTPGFLLPQGGGSVPTTQSVEDKASERLRHRQHESLQNNTGEGDSNPTFPDDREVTGTKSDFYLQSLTDEINKIAQERLQKFRLLSSPRARRLAMLLAASPVITLPVMRLIRASMQPEISPLPVAEVFLGGVIKKSTRTARKHRPRRNPI